MLLYINDDKTVADLQDKFNECFPYLKIELYDTMHHWQHASAEGREVSGDMKIGDIRKNHNIGTFEIMSFYKAGKVEQDFRHQFGLFVQIFFKMDNVWVQSVTTDDLTLGQLSDMAEQSKKLH